MRSIRPFASNRRGSAPLLVMLVTSFAATLAWTFRSALPLVEPPVVALASQGEARRASLAATGATLALHHLWVPFELSRDDASETEQRHLRAYLDEFGLADGADWLDITARLDLGRLVSAAASGGRDARLVHVGAQRRDEPHATRIVLRLTTETGETAVGSSCSTFDVEYELGPRRWSGLGVALSASRLDGPIRDARVEGTASPSSATGHVERRPAAFPGATAPRGTITGGHRSLIAAGSTIDDSHGLDELREASNVARLEGLVEGSVHLVGTEVDPLVIDGELAIDGDLVVSGYVRGAGSIRVSGNVYLPSSLIYADGRDSGGERTFGLAADGSENVLAIGAGGNVLLGDVLRSRASTGSLLGMSLARFNRDEWTRTQPVLPAAEDDWSDPTGWTVVNPLYAGTSYVPRYYAFGEGSPIALLGDGHFDADSHGWIDRDQPFGRPRVWHADARDPRDRFLGRRAHPKQAVVLTLTANRSWIDEERLRQLLAADARADTAPGLTIDATLYSSNAILGQLDRDEVTFEGALVAAHIAVHAPGELVVRHDPRGEQQLELHSTTELDVRRLGTTRVIAP